jgi:hypothetical protein
MPDFLAAPFERRCIAALDARPQRIAPKRDFGPIAH